MSIANLQETDVSTTAGGKGGTSGCQMALDDYECINIHISHPVKSIFQANLPVISTYCILGHAMGWSWDMQAVGTAGLLLGKASGTRSPAADGH